MANRCGDCDFLNYRDTKWNGDRVWCNRKGYYVDPSSIACNDYTYKGHNYGRYLTTFVCNTLKLDDKKKKYLYKCFDEIKYDKTPEADYLYEMFSQYDIIGPMIADKLYKDKFKEVIATSMLYNYIYPCVDMALDKNYLKAILKYEEMCDTLYNFYFNEDNITRKKSLEK